MATTEIAARLIADLKRDFGLSHAQAAGVAGNLAHESGGFKQFQEIGASGKGGLGYAQWTGPRRKNFVSWANKQGLGTDSYEANYGFLKHEIENDPYERKQFMKVKNASTPEEAAKIVSKNYLRPGVPHLDRRVDYAQEFSNLGSAPSALAAIDQIAPSPQDRPTALAFNDTSRAVTPPALPQVPIPAGVNDKVLARTFGALSDLPPSLPNRESPVGLGTSLDQFNDWNDYTVSGGRVGPQSPSGAGTSFAQLQDWNDYNRPVPTNTGPSPVARISDASRANQNFNRENSDLIAQINNMPPALEAPIPAPRPDFMAPTEHFGVFNPMGPEHRPPTGEEYEAGSGFRVGLPKADRLAESQAALPLDLPPVSEAPSITPIPMPPISRGILAPNPVNRIDRKGALDFGGVKLPGILGVVQGIDHAAANASGPRSSNYDNLMINVMNPGTRSSKSVRDEARRTGNHSTLKRGDRRYNADTNKWEVK